MAYEIKSEKTYPHSLEKVYQAAKGAISGLEGKILKEEEDQHLLKVQFHKRILGKVLGDRTQMTLVLSENGPEETTAAITILPVDAVGRELKFGARKGVSKTVLSWFYAHLEHRLK